MNWTTTITVVSLVEGVFLALNIRAKYLSNVVEQTNCEKKLLVTLHCANKTPEGQDLFQRKTGIAFLFNLMTVYDG